MLQRLQYLSDGTRYLRYDKDQRQCLHPDVALQKPNGVHRYNGAVDQRDDVVNGSPVHRKVIVEYIEATHVHGRNQNPTDNVLERVGWDFLRKEGRHEVIRCVGRTWL